MIGVGTQFHCLPPYSDTCLTAFTTANYTVQYWASHADAMVNILIIIIETYRASAAPYNTM